LITVNAFNPINNAANDPSPPTPTNDSAKPIASILLSLTCLSKSEMESAGIFEFYFTWNSREPRISDISVAIISLFFCGARLS